MDKLKDVGVTRNSDLVESGADEFVSQPKKEVNKPEKKPTKKKK